jgi:hypothetical protein
LAKIKPLPFDPVAAADRNGGSDINSGTSSRASSSVSMSSRSSLEGSDSELRDGLAALSVQQPEVSTPVKDQTQSSVVESVAGEDSSALVEDLLVHSKKLPENDAASIIANDAPPQAAVTKEASAASDHEADAHVTADEHTADVELASTSPTLQSHPISDHSNSNGAYRNGHGKSHGKHKHRGKK